MKNKTVANWLIGSFAVCLFAAFMSSADQDAFYTLGGTGVLIFSVWSIVKMFKAKADWLPITFSVAFGSFVVLSMADSESELFGLLGIGVWVLAILAIIRLYKTPDVIE